MDYDVLEKRVVKNYRKKKREATAEKKRQRELIEEGLAVKFDTSGETEPKVICADFYDYCMNNIEPNSIDIIITDPPYPKEYLHVWEQLSEVGDRVLKPGGFCVSYSGQYYLPIVMNSLGEHLKYYWTFCLSHSNKTQIVNGKNIMCGWKPVLVYQEGPVQKLERTIFDCVKSDERDKQNHIWGQSVGGLDVLIERFTKPNDLILDPFVGGGTTLVSAKKLKRRGIGIDIDMVCVNTTKARLVEG